MIRKIIKINEEKCNGCGLCVLECHEGAIGIANGKAKLIRDDYCDGLGDCLPVCPKEAITFERREAAEYNEEAVRKNMERKSEKRSRLKQFPIQIKLAPTNAPYFNNADLLISADCAAYAHGDFHNEFIKDRITLIGCPKLDECDYSNKLTEIIKTNDVKSVAVARMEVPCCVGIERAVKTALQNCGKLIPWQVITISINGKIKDI